MGDVDEKIFWVADERMSGDGGGRYARPVMQGIRPVMRSTSGRVRSAAPTLPPRNAEGGGVALTQRG
jgi:hypothetical protein